MKRDLTKEELEQIEKIKEIFTKNPKCAKTAAQIAIEVAGKADKWTSAAVLVLLRHMKDNGFLQFTKNPMNKNYPGKWTRQGVVPSFEDKDGNLITVDANDIQRKEIIEQLNKIENAVKSIKLALGE